MGMEEKWGSGNRVYERVKQLISRYPMLSGCIEPIINSFLVLRNSFTNGNKLLICGNGGSAADAEHLSGELMKGFLSRRPLSPTVNAKLSSFTGNPDHWVDRLQGALPVIPLPVNSGLISAINNDIGADLIFAQQIIGYGVKGDCLLAISTSGNSENILKAVIVAKALDIRTIGLTGDHGGKIKEFCEIMIQVPAETTPEIQELHLPVYHSLAAMLEEEFFNQPPPK